jgi:hypothetical protein
MEVEVTEENREPSATTQLSTKRPSMPVASCIKAIGFSPLEL